MRERENWELGIDNQVRSDQYKNIKTCNNKKGGRGAREGSGKHILQRKLFDVKVRKVFILCRSYWLVGWLVD